MSQQAQPQEASEPETPHLDFSRHDAVRGLRQGGRAHPPPAHPLRRSRRDGLPGHHPGHGAVVHGHRARVGDRRAGAPPGPGAGGDRRAEAVRPRAGRAERVLAAARAADPGAVQLVPLRARRGIRLPVGDVPPHGVPARREVRVHAGPAPRRAPRPRGAGEGAARAEPVRRGAGAAGPARSRDPGGRPGARHLAPVRALGGGRGGLDGRVRGRRGCRDRAPRRGPDGRRRARVALAQRPPRRDPPRDGREGRRRAARPHVAWLEKRAQKNVFPELWTARSHV